MSIKRYISNKDTTITNAYKPDLRNRATDANMGASDVMEIFSIFGQASTSSIEKSRILVDFPINDIVTDRNTGKIPVSGSVNFYLRIFNVEHSDSVPRDFALNIAPISQSWDEGFGLDMETYIDKGWGGTNGRGSTWLYASSGTLWTEEGGDYLSGSNNLLKQNFSSGLEDLEIDVTSITERWISGSLSNYGFVVFLSGGYESGTENTSFYSKKFSTRSSEYYLRRPCLEARWNPSITDDRNNFYSSSSLLSAEDNTMYLYFYSRVNGKLKNIVNNPIPTVIFYSDSLYTNAISSSYLSASNPTIGVYKVAVAIETTASVLYDKWVNSSNNNIKYYSGSFDVYQRENSNISYEEEKIINITNLKAKYSSNELVKFNIFIRERDWQPNIYSIAYNNVENTSIPNLYYKIFRFNDNYTIVDYSTGSLAYTKASYDSNGNYFEFDMNILEKDYGYGIKLATWDGIELKEFNDIFKFRVE
jgi:hypothetical protein